MTFDVQCPACRGMGEIRIDDPMGLGMDDWEPCYECGGTGHYEDDEPDDGWVKL